MPQLQAYMPSPAPTSYSTVGTYSTYGNQGSFQATTTANGGFASGYAAGANMGANIVNTYALGAARRRQEELKAACMRTTGWIDTSTEDGKAQFSKATAALSSEKAKKRATDAEDRSQSEWHAAIDTFIDAEAARPGGINYLQDEAKLVALDKYVKQLANDPKNKHQKMSWFLIEAHKRVVGDIQTSTTQ